MKKYITIAAALVILIGAIAISKGFKNRKKPTRPKKEITLPLAFVEEVKNKSLPVIIPTDGRLVAKNKIKLLSEVQGVLQYSSKEFKPGVHFNKGELIYKLNSDEFYTNLLAQKSSFQNQIAAIIPDLRIDYPNSFQAWDYYLKQFDITKPLAELPNPQSDKEKLFVAAKNIYTSFYTLKNLEIKLKKFTVHAPFSGTLTEANITPGSLVSPGQTIGEFLDPSLFEMEVAISSSLVSKINIGDSVLVQNLEEENLKYPGKIIRINEKVDINSQTIKVFIQVKGSGLKEGMYLKANLKSKVFDHVFEVKRNLLVNENEIYTVENSKLKLQKIHIIHQGEKSLLVKGLEDNQLLLTKPVPKAFQGMEVKIYEKN